MNKLQTSILRMDFRKAAKQFIIIAVAFLLVSAVVIGLSCRTQIGEAISLHRQGYELSGENGHENDGDKENILSENVGQIKDGRTQEQGHLSPLSTAAKAFLVAVLGIGALLGLVYWLLIATWLYQAAVSVSMNGALWFILGIFFNLGTVIAFFIVRSSKAACPVCGKRQDKSGYCRFCGSKMQVLCEKCGAEINHLDAYCHNCGVGLKSGEK